MRRLLLATMVMLLLGVYVPTPTCLSRTVEATVSVAPAQITITPGESFTINITVSNVNNLNAWQLLLEYNASIINCTAAWIPEDDVFANQNPILVAPVLNVPTVDGYNYSGYGKALFSGSVDVSQGTLCKLNFTCQRYGLTPLQIGTKTNPVRIGDIKKPISIRSLHSSLIDPNQMEIPFTAQDCVVNNGLQPILTIEPTLNGTTSPQPGNYTCTFGANFSVTAIPDNDYSVDHWLIDGNIAGNTNPISVFMTDNHELQPVFAQANCTLTILQATGGNASLAPGTYVYPAGQTAQVSATAENGYSFSYWMLDSSSAGSANPLSILMEGNHTLTPIFSSTGYAYVYIRADGSIDPAGVPLSTSDNVTYMLVGDLNSMITVQRSNVIIDGGGYTLQGSGTAEGFRLIGVDNVSITNANIRGFDGGIDLSTSSQDVIAENNITANNGLGISLYNSCNSTICRNNIAANKLEGIHLDYSSNFNNINENNIEDNSYSGIYIDSSSNNLIYHNNMINNTIQVYVSPHGYSPTNSWGSDGEGNFWSDYVGVDSDSDGIGDTPYVIDANNTDHFPLMGTFSSHSMPQGYSVGILSNSSIANFNCSSTNRRISFDTEGKNGSVGFCRLVIPHVLMDVDRIEVVIDNGNTPVLYQNLNLRDNMTHRWILFAYKQSDHAIVIHEDWTPPAIAILSPENKTYSLNNVSLSFAVSEETSWKGYSLDGSVNETIAGNTTLIDLVEGSHVITVYANDTVGNMGASNTVLFTVDTTPPTILILSPENRTYSMSNVLLDFTITEQTSWEGYSLDNEPNATMTGNLTLNGLPDGTHSLIVYANDTVGNMGASNTVHFAVDTTPPNITQVTQDPPENNVSSIEPVAVNVTAVDPVSGVMNVSLVCTYTNSSGTFTSVISMTNIQGDEWNATIPAFPYGTNVTYSILAEDKAGNTMTTQDVPDLYREYVVASEHWTPVLMSLLLTFSLLAALLAKRGKQHCKDTNAANSHLCTESQSSHCSSCNQVSAI